MKPLPLIVLGAVALCFAAYAGRAQTAAAPAVYPGCNPPPAIGAGAKFYVDSVRGNDLTGDGSQAKPWKSLANITSGEVNCVPKTFISTAPAYFNNACKNHVLANPNAPIKPGATLYVSGPQGDVLIQGYYGTPGSGFDNGTGWITIAGLSTQGGSPADVPTIHSLRGIGLGGWRFTGLHVTGINTGVANLGGSAQSAGYQVSFAYAHHDVVFDHNQLDSAPDAVAVTWTMAQWNAGVMNGVSENGGTCVAIDANGLRNLGSGIAAKAGSQIEINGNVPTHLTGDGVDYGSSNLEIAFNAGSDEIEDGDGLHADFMQGQPANVANTYSNVSIHDNSFNRLGDGWARWPRFTQGIDLFDGHWTNVSAIRNTIVTDAAQCMSFYGVDGITIQKNVCLADSSKVVYCTLSTSTSLTLAQCAATPVTWPGYPATPPYGPPEIVVSQSKLAAPATVTDVSENVSTGIGVSLNTINASAIHDNQCVPIFQRGKMDCTMGIPVNGVMVWKGLPGQTVGARNTVAGADPYYMPAPAP